MPILYAGDAQLHQLWDERCKLKAEVETLKARVEELERLVGVRD